MTKLGEALSMLFKLQQQNELKRGTVKSVNKQSKTCVVSPIDGGADYIDVKLTAEEGDNVQSVVFYPKVSSSVYIGIIEGNESDTFVAQMTEVDEIIYHDGKNGGMCITPELVKQLERISKRIDRIESSLKNAKPIAQDGGIALQQTIVSELNTPLAKEDFSKIENKKILH